MDKVQAGEGFERVGHDIANTPPSTSTKRCNSPAKPSKPSRAYFHVKTKDYPAQLGDKVRSTVFNDAKNSGKDPSLLGPPTVEYCTYGRVPNARPRKDARQSTIDQDPEFIDFLESLTNPIIKSTTVDQENESAKTKEKVTVTPLIQFLRDKKANKSKEGPAKNAKHGRQDSKEGKGAANLNNKNPPVVVASSKKRSAQAAKVEQAARDAVKVLNKQTVGAKGAASSTPPAPAAKTTTPNVTPNSTANAALADKKRERGNASAAAKILQRDLGLGGSPAGRGGRGGRSGTVGRPVTGVQTNAKPGQGASQDTAAAGAATATIPANTGAASSSEPKPTPTLLQKPTAPPTGPAASRGGPAATPTTQPKAIATPPPSASTQAFLKHANPSQGITEPLLEEALSGFGTIKNVEIDKKKGFAYVDFESPEGLQKAMKASPIKVAQGQVVVLERKTGPTLQARNVRGGGGGGGASGSPLMGNRGGGGGPAMNARGGNARGRAGGLGRGGTQSVQGSKGKAAPGGASSPAAAPAVAAAQQAGENITLSAAAAVEP